MKKQQSAEYFRKCNAERYARLKESGMCVTCGKNPSSPGRTRCETCAAENRLQSKYTVRRRKAMGLCAYCGKVPPVEGKTCCAPCLEVARERIARSMAKRKAERSAVNG